MKALLQASGKRVNIIKIIVAVRLTLKFSHFTELLACGKLAEYHCNAIHIELLKENSVVTKTT